MRKEHDIEVKANVVARQSPELENFKQKAIADASELDLIERNTIGQIKEDGEDGEEERS